MMARYPAERNRIECRDVELIGDLSEIETIAAELSVRDNADRKARIKLSCPHPQFVLLATDATTYRPA
jgi:hypothetical protein